jgi:hypothetical protein
MPRYQIADIKVQGHDVILVALEAAFGRKPENEKQRSLAEFQLRCRGAGLRGGVAILWPTGAQTHFMGPANWRSYLQSIDLTYAVANRNRWIEW